MKWIIALAVSALMFFAGYYHAARYESDETQNLEGEQKTGDQAESGESGGSTS